MALMLHALLIVIRFENYIYNTCIYTSYILIFVGMYWYAIEEGYIKNNQEF